MKYYAIIVAGGKGNRMNLAVANNFRTGRQTYFNAYPGSLPSMCPKSVIILVLNIHQHLFWEELCTKHDFKVPHQVIKGGQERFDSVKWIKSNQRKAVVAIHDAVRP
ncbi:hypothetical protein CS542_04120 [Pedobacter sp. IW39]|nr:hypothetical protein CS542_04120 [Pedobacter sp. IW39]